MLSLTDIVFLMGLGFSLAAPLGPVNMEMIKRSLQSKYGYLLGIFTGLGAMTGDFIIATTVLFIGAEFLRGIIEITVVFIILLIFNVGFLSYIGISALRSSTDELPDLDDETVPVSVTQIGRQLVTGFVIVVTSPWSYFWWSSFGGFILNSGLPLGNGLERLLVTGVFLAGIFVWVVSFCFVLGVSQRLASPRILNLITNISAVIILLFAVVIGIDGVRSLLGLGRLADLI